MYETMYETTFESILEETIEMNMGPMMKHAESCLSSIEMTPEEAYHILYDHYTDYFRRHTVPPSEPMDQYCIRLVCPYCNHCCEICQTLKHDHVRDCLYDRVIDGLDKHLDSKECRAPPSVSKRMDDLVVRYREIKRIRKPSQRRQQMLQMVNSCDVQLYQYVERFPEMEIGRMFDLVMEAEIQRHLIYDHTDTQNILDGKFQHLCVYCCDDC